MVAQKAKVHGGQFLKICSLKLCDIFSQNVYFYHILTNENFNESWTDDFCDTILLTITVQLY